VDGDNPGAGVPERYHDADKRFRVEWGKPPPPQVAEQIPLTDNSRESEES
jgi:hypothetical protein